MKSVINNILAKVEQKENTFAMISTERQICEPKTNKQAKTICPKRRRQIITIGVQEPMLQNVFAVAKLWQIFYLLKAFARFQMDCTKHGALKLKDMMASIYPIVKPIGYN